MPMTTRRQLLQSTSALALAAILPRCASVAEQKPPLQPVTFADIPRSDFGFATTADEVVAGIDLTGKTVLITGCNSGLGYESLRTLAAQGAHVIGTARTLEKAEAARDQVRSEFAQASITPLVCELTDMNSVVACAAVANSVLDDNNTALDILICNAGIMALPKLEQIDVNGVLLEKQFVVNHLGHYLLTRRLLPQVVAAPAPRIVMVSSVGYTLAPAGGIQFDNLSGDSCTEGKCYQPFKNYGQTKLANILFSNELDRRYFDRGITSNAIHPGLVGTNLGRYMTGRMRDPDDPLRKGMKSAAQGAATQVYVATNPSLANVSGYYFEDSNPVELKGPYANDRELAAQLWDVSEGLVSEWL